MWNGDPTVLSFLKDLRRGSSHPVSRSMESAVRLACLALIVLALPACIELDEELVVDTDPPTTTPDEDDGRPDPQRPDPTDPPTPDGPVAGFAVTPDRAARCAVELLSLTADEPLDVEDVLFEGPSSIEVLTLDVREDEVLLTIAVDEGSLAGQNDIVLAFPDGDVVVPDAFRISGSACD